MPKEIIIDGENIINATDWKAKSEHIIAKLDEELFDRITEDDLYNYRYDKDGCVSSKTKIKLGKGEIKPVISATKVMTVLNRLLRIYRPMNLSEAQTLAPEEYIEANLYYLDIISHKYSFVNTYFQIFLIFFFFYKTFQNCIQNRPNTRPLITSPRRN